MRLLLLAGILALCSVPVLAGRADLPPPAEVQAALDNHPGVAAARARIDVARAHGQMLQRGPHEVELGGSYSRRTIDQEGRYNEFDATISRPFRLPGKATLDRETGVLGIEVATQQMADTRQQAALMLSELWHDWLTAGSHVRNDRELIAGLEQAANAIRRRVALRDASPLELDQALAALAQARAQAAASLSRREQARSLLAATFPDIALAVEPPELAMPVLPGQGLDSMRDLAIERSHLIRAADREAQRMDVAARRVKADRMADPTFGVRLFSERGGAETGAGVIASIPLGGGYRRAAADQASAEAGAARLELLAARRNVQATADADLSNARTRMEAWRNADISARSAGDAADRTRRGYQLGEIDLTDQLYARRQANEARRMEIDARSEANRALLKLEITAQLVWAADDTPGEGQ